MFAKALNIRTTVLHWRVIIISTIDWVTLEFHLVTHTAVVMLKAFHSLYSSWGAQLLTSPVPGLH